MTNANILPSDSRLVWYAVYGSNLLKKRFGCYIAGGKPEGSKTEYPGCRDKTPPRGDRPTSLRHALYFAGHSNSWDAAIAFVRHASSTALTYGRMFLISYGQLNDVVRQENAGTFQGPSLCRLTKSSPAAITGRSTDTGLTDVSSRQASRTVTP